MTGKTHNTIPGARRLAAALPLLLAALAAGLSSCDSMIYEYEGDCTVHYEVNFRYDWNLLEADAFASQVERVTLYVIDSLGNIALRQSGSGPALAEPGYAMELDLEPGTYTLVAWGGARDSGSFVFDDGSYDENATAVSLDCSYEEGQPYFDGEVDELFYGRLEGAEFGTAPGATYSHTVDLMKDTNTVRVVLQEINAGQLDVGDFGFSIISDDWALDWGNGCCADVPAVYYPFYTGNAEMEVETDTRATAVYGAAIAEFTISRIMADRAARLTVYRRDSSEEPVISYRIEQLAALMKGHYMLYDDQEYLDREDTYDIVFLLDGDEGYRWDNVNLWVNSWHVVLQDAGL